MRKIILFSKIAIVVLMLILLNFIQKTYADENKFSVDANFYKHSRLAEEKKLPMLVLFSSIYCVYCQYIKDEFLEPMIKSGDYVDKVVITVVEDDISDEIIDFDGKELDSGKFSDRYSINFTPTILFMDHKGKEIVQRIIGLGNVDYFGGDLDNGIDNALMVTREMQSEKND